MCRRYLLLTVSWVRTGTFRGTFFSRPAGACGSSAMRRSDSWVFPGGGDLIFRSVTVISSSYNRRTGYSQSRRTIHYGFLSIAHVKDVEKLVRETLIDRFVDKLTEASSL